MVTQKDLLARNVAIKILLILDAQAVVIMMRDDVNRSGRYGVRK